MEVGRLPISASQRGKLIAAGYTTLSTLSSLSPSHLAQDLKIEEGEAVDILKAASHGSRLQASDGNHALVDGAQTAWDMLHEEEFLTQITTSCAELDDILGGGISCKEVTEIGGIPGIGKTQLGIQLAINVQIPVDLGGLAGKSIYIDTEGSFMVERALQIAEACLEDMYTNPGPQRKDSHALQVEMQPKDFLGNIYYFRICSYTEQIALINYLDKFISEHNDVKLVIIDSVTFHFRQDFDDLALRTRVLSGMALKMMQIAKKFSLAPCLTLRDAETLRGLLAHFERASGQQVNVTKSMVMFNRGVPVEVQHQTADTLGVQISTNRGSYLGMPSVVGKSRCQVVMLNQVTTKYSEGSFQLTLALGDSWSHACTNRIILYWNGDEQYAYIDKSPSLRSASAPYSVTSRGIRSSSNCKRVKMM